MVLIAKGIKNLALRHSIYLWEWEKTEDWVRKPEFREINSPERNDFLEKSERSIRIENSNSLIEGR